MSRAVGQRVQRPGPARPFPDLAVRAWQYHVILVDAQGLDRPKRYLGPANK